MASKRYLTAKEVADKFGISIQTVYNKLEKNWKQYLKIIDGKKHVHIKVLNEIEQDGPFQNHSKFVQNLNDNLNSDLNGILEFYKEQLKQKDNQIEQLQELVKREQDLRMVSDQKIMLLLETKEETKENPSSSDVEPEGKEMVYEESEEKIGTDFPEDDVDHYPKSDNEKKEPPKKKWFEFWR